MDSTNEIAREKNEEKIRRNREDFYKRFENGLENLKTLEFDDKIDPLPEARKKFREACETSLSGILAAAGKEQAARIARAAKGETE